MGREIRRVPPDWEHPKNKRGHYEPLLDETHWQGIWSHIRYDLGFYIRHPKYLGEWFAEWPKPSWYRPAFRQVPTHYQIYETVSEGTPTSPVFATKDGLVEWLIEQGHSEAAAQAFAKEGWAPSMVTASGYGVVMGIESLAIPPRPTA